LLRKSLQSPRALARAADAAPASPGLTGANLKPGELIWYYGDGKKYPGTTLAIHPSGEEAMIQFWELGKIGEKLGKEMRESLVPVSKVCSHRRCFFFVRLTFSAIF